jgi:hypothetical protein
MGLFNEIVAILRHSRNPGPEPLAGFGHGVPVETAHHLLDLLHQGFGSAVRRLLDMSRRYTQAKWTLGLR